MGLPELPGYAGEGYEWMSELGNGWHAVSGWGEDGWDLGSWPYVIICHYDGDSEEGEPFGLAVYVESDTTIQEFSTKEERDQATDETAIFYWKYEEVFGAPRFMSDGRLGPYRRY